MLDLLTISRRPIKKTDMLYNANLNFDQLERYLDMLQNMGLIELVQTPFKGYKITNKGEIIVRSLIPSEPSNIKFQTREREECSLASHS
jgi:predicted transcriptional regulator